MDFAEILKAHFFLNSHFAEILEAHFLLKMHFAEIMKDEIYAKMDFAEILKAHFFLKMPFAEILKAEICAKTVILTLFLVEKFGEIAKEHRRIAFLFDNRLFLGRIRRDVARKPDYQDSRFRFQLKCVATD